ncbi:MAG: TonB-dependent receptor [Opitutaceae bacterium]
MGVVRIVYGVTEMTPPNTMQSQHIFSGHRAIERGPRLGLSALLAAITLPLSVFAQTTIDTEGTTVELEAFEVSGYRSALADSLDAKRQSNQVSDSIMAEEIGQFPDTNLAEAIQRIAGVAMTRNNGEGEKVSVRGLNPNFTRVEINGRSSMMTVDDNSPERDAQLSVFNSDLYNSIEVIKSPSARDVEGGIGGTVKLNTFKPLQIGKMSYGFDVSYAMNDFKDSDEPGISAFYSNIFADGKAGFLVQATFEERDRRVDRIESNRDFLIVDTGFLKDDSDPAQLALVGAAYPGRTRYFSKAGDNPRFNLTSTLQFQPTEDLELYIDGLISRERRDEDRSRIQMTWSRGDLISGVVDPVTGTLVQATIDRHRVDQDSLIRDTDVESTGVTGGFIWNHDLLKVSGEISISEGSEDWFQSQAQSRVNRDGVASYDIRPNHQMPIMTTPGIFRNPEDISLRALLRQHRIIFYKEDVMSLDIERALEGEFFSSIEAGIRVTDNEFDRKQGDSRTASNAGDITFAQGANPSWGLQGDFGFGKGSAGFPVSWAVTDPDLLIEQNPLEDTIIPFNNDNVYTVEEETTALYFMANFAESFGNNRARGNIGVRYVDTKAGGVGNINAETNSGDLVVVGEPTTLDQDYAELLPSLNLILSPDDPQAPYQVRMAASKAMSRPTTREMSPLVSISEPDGEIERGNPQLDPFTAWQYDLGIETFFGDNDEGMFAITGFIKDVESFIVPTSFNETVGFPSAGIPSQSFQVDTFKNGGTADIKGVEMSFQTPFTFLPSPLSDFGTMINYTYIDSEFIDEAGNSNPFPGTSENTYNIVLFYEKGGFSTRFAYNFRDDYLKVPSPTGDGRNNEFTEGVGRLDIGIRYRWESGFKIAVDIINLTEEQDYIYYDVYDRLEQLTMETMHINVSFGYKF